jgi:hypothetical protein
LHRRKVCLPLHSPMKRALLIGDRKGVICKIF